MVDWYGNWTYGADTVEEKKCDCDRIIDWICERGYTPETSMENLVHMILLSFDCCDNYGKYDPETGCGGYGDFFTLEGCKQYVEDSSGFREFDWYCQGGKIDGNF